MNAPKNQRRNAKTRAPRRRDPMASRVGTACVALLLGCLSALGLWRCLDDGARDAAEPIPDAGSIAAGAPATEAEPPRIDIGHGIEPDPTLVNEQALIESEEPEEIEVGSAAPLPAEPASADVGEEERLLAKYPMHAVAYHFHAQVFAEPDRGSRVIGYARRGATMRVGERVGTRDCARGWHGIRGGGFICDGLGFNVGAEPLTFTPSPPAPREEEALPYDYRQVRTADTPQYWRVPTPEERRETAEIIARLAAGGNGKGGRAAREEAGALDSAELERVLARAAAVAEDADAGAIETADEPAAPAAGDPSAAASPAESKTAVSQQAEEPADLPAYVHMRMNRGFYVSVDDVVRAEDGASFTRTVRSRFVPAEVLAPPRPSEFEGALLDGDVQLPLVFVVGAGASLLQRKGDSGPLVQKGTAERYRHYPFLGRIRHAGRSYVQVGENLFLAERVAAVAERIDPPRNLLPGERWIAVDLGRQTLVAYEGETPVFATLVATGRKEYPTPAGEFRIYGKHVSVNMADTDAGEESYSIEDVPWTQFYQGGYALHGAFWHDRFGRVRSHGCVTLSPADARRLFYWTGPVLAPGLHGAIATRENPGTRIVIHD